MCKICVKKTRSAIRIDVILSSFIKNETHLKHGDPLSTILFNWALQKVI